MLFISISTCIFIDINVIQLTIIIILCYDYYRYCYTIVINIIIINIRDNYHNIYSCCNITYMYDELNIARLVTAPTPQH